MGGEGRVIIDKFAYSQYYFYIGSIIKLSDGTKNIINWIEDIKYYNKQIYKYKLEQVV